MGLARPDVEDRHRLDLGNSVAGVGRSFEPDVGVVVHPWSCPASGSDLEAFLRREVFPVPVDRFYRVAVLGEVLAVDLAGEGLAVGASTVAGTVHLGGLPGRDSTVASDIAAEFRRIVELEFARPTAC